MLFLRKCERSSGENENRDNKEITMNPLILGGFSYAYIKGGGERVVWQKGMTI